MEQEKEVTAAVSDDVGAKQRLLAISGCLMTTIDEIASKCNRIYVLFKSQRRNRKASFSKVSSLQRVSDLSGRLG